MNYFLVDFENVKTDGLKKLVVTKKGDKIIIFYSENCKNISLDIIENIKEQNMKLGCYKVDTGTKNALDFQLSSYLGYLIGKKGDSAKYHIVSNDKGYDCLCSYWKKQKVFVDRIALADTVKEVDEVPQTQTTKTKKSKVQKNDLATLKEIKSVLEERDCPEIVLEIFNHYKTKQSICNGMAKEFKDSKKASAIYKKLKPLLTEKHKS